MGRAAARTGLLLPDADRATDVPHRSIAISRQGRTELANITPRRVAIHRATRREVNVDTHHSLHCRAAGRTIGSPALQENAR